jgi:WD40 repeat protein
MWAAALGGHIGLARAMAVAPGGTMLATCAAETVRIWDTGTWRPIAMMRVDSDISALGWLGDTQFAIAGSAGLYLFGFDPSR